MISFFRHRREEKARVIIRAELVKLDKYEAGHVERQEERTGPQAAKHPHKPMRPHGEYAPDQRREHVQILVLQQMKRPPARLDILLREEIPDEE
jgi:hypothetical protein